MESDMSRERMNRRAFLGTSVTTMGAASLATSPMLSSNSPAVAGDDGSVAPPPEPGGAEREMPCGTIGKVQISRLILGSNLMGGYAHSRDLAYVGPLMRAYNTEEKIMETLALAEAEGINTISQGDTALIKKYNEQHGGRLQQLAPLHVDVNHDPQQIRDAVRATVDQGPVAIYVFGHDSDQLVRAERADLIATAVQYVRDEGLPAGVGGHSLHVVLECEKHQIAPDFYFKTFHRDNYWSRILTEHRDEYCWYQGASSDPGHYHDNMWCMDPERTAEVMRDVSAAWIAFKVLAAGAIPPQMGFSYALRRGADFIVVGMFDFQVRENAELVRQTLQALKQRDRPWRA
jgi:hypothetical protein